MIWLTLRQLRTQIISTLILLIAYGALLLATGIDADSYISSHMPNGCPGPQPACQAFDESIRSRYAIVQTVLGITPLFLHILAGALWGAPIIAREVERGTGKLAWTQSITLRHWLTAKLGLSAAIVVVSGLLFSAMVTRWRTVFGELYSTSFISPDVFNLTGVSPAAWWLFMFALGTAAGAVFGRVLAAMAVAVLVGLIMLPGLVMLRSSYAPPLRMVTTEMKDSSSDALVAGKWLTPTRDEVTQPTSAQCPLSSFRDGADPRYWRCLTDEGYRYVIYYHPSRLFWEFQWKEAALLGCASVLLGGITVIRVRRLRAA